MSGRGTSARRLARSKKRLAVWHGVSTARDRRPAATTVVSDAAEPTTTDRRATADGASLSVATDQSETVDSRDGVF